MSEILEAFEVELSALSQWLAENAAAKAGTPEYRRKSMAHRLVADLVTAGGGTPEQRMEVMRRLNEDNPT